MAEKYLSEEEKELNMKLKKLQNRASKLILCDYYDCITLSEIQYSILTKITNAESYKDISLYLWNTGLMEKTLDDIAEKIKNARKQG